MQRGETSSNGPDYFSSIDCSVFCEDWARALVKGEKENPVFLRQVIENYKLKVHCDERTVSVITLFAFAFI